MASAQPSEPSPAISGAGGGSAVIAIVGGTGPLGRGLAYRFACAGRRVVIGSRCGDRARAAAAELSAWPGVRGSIGGTSNVMAGHDGDVAIIAVPWEGHAETVTALRDCLAGKLVIDCVNPLGFDERGPYALRVPEGSAAEQAQSLLPDSRVCAAFHHASARLLTDSNVDSIDLDVLVLGDDRLAVAAVIELAEAIPGVRGVHAGRLRNAGPVEALAGNLIAINRRYRTQAGVRVTNLTA